MALYKDEEVKSEESDEDINDLKEEINSLTQQLKNKDKVIQKNLEVCWVTKRLISKLNHWLRWKLHWTRN